MNRLSQLLPIAILLLLLSCNQGGNKKIPADVVSNPISADSEKGIDRLPRIEFEETAHDFGTVIQGEKVIYNYKFTNTGKSDLLIAKVEATCGCTAIKYPRHPIKPGEGDMIAITFNSEGRLGIQNKVVRVVANTQPNVVTLKVKATVIKPEKM
jgi:hypothetical protein